MPCIRLTEDFEEVSTEESHTLLEPEEEQCIANVLVRFVLALLKLVVLVETKLFGRTGSFRS